ncbi:hypothetical protein [Pseudoalteromonas spongiae]|uniref:Solute-binding protein family 3/N-terminal domain-containing protein n=1 Tax=Pseudoalteromonas spongiae TaxID=298657 RepID=A0ABU8EXJ8_9GAMM
MRFIVYIICLISLLGALPTKAEQITIAAAHWREFSEPGGEGIYLELVKQTLAGKQLKFDVGSYARAKRLFKNHKADVLVGVYKNDKTLLGDVTYPKYHLDMEFPIIAIYNPRTTKLRHSEDFKDLTVGWFEEYAYNRYVPEHAQSYRFTDIHKALMLLESGKVDVVVDHIYNLSERQKLIFETLELQGKTPIWLVFHDNERGRLLKNQFELAFEQLYHSKALAELFGEHYEHANFPSLFLNK